MTTPNEAILPAALAQIAEIAGREAALRLAFRYGGSRVYIPRQFEGSEIVQIVGAEAAKALAGHFGGESIAVPIGKKALAFWLDEQGWSKEKIAVELRVDRTTVHRWLADRMESLQLKLFG
ncbi:MAG: hypothetical protein ACK4Q4_00660 [Rhodocyclaceae bacterium]